MRSLQSHGRLGIWSCSLARLAAWQTSALLSRGRRRALSGRNTRRIVEHTLLRTMDLACGALTHEPLDPLPVPGWRLPERPEEEADEPEQLAPDEGHDRGVAEDAACGCGVQPCWSRVAERAGRPLLSCHGVGGFC